MKAPSKTVFISVAEDSADRHAEKLLRVAKQRLPHVKFVGFCGPRMQAAGATALDDLTGGAAMLGAALRKRGMGKRALAMAEEYWRQHSPDLFLPMDSSLLHLPMAARAKQHGLSVLYYIAPQTWASRAYRNRAIREHVDRLACILPFEEDYFRQHGIAARFVGHPLFESAADEVASAGRSANASNRGTAPTLAILPGSREGVIRKMLPLQLAVARAMRTTPRVLVSCADVRRRPIVERYVRTAQFPVQIVVGDVVDMLRPCDLALVTSGTATLNVAAAHKPMVVMYDPGRLLAIGHRAFGSFFLRTRYLSLVNILAQKKVTPEYMTAIPDPVQIARSADQLLRDTSLRTWMIEQLRALTGQFRLQQPSANVCDEIQRFLH
ncbi:MAG: lipid-A-disaccharide synthase [Phycisphaerae bacterium]